MNRETISRNRNRVTQAWLMTLPALALAGCRALGPDYAFVTGESAPRLVQDSPEVRRLLEQAWRHNLVAGKMWVGRTEQEVVELEYDIRTHPEKYMTERRALFADMARQPGVTVTGRQYFLLLRESAT